MKKFIILAMIALTGCATGYKPQGFMSGGFEETELEPGYFRVTFKGNDSTSKERAADFALLRASDLMMQKGCSAFKVVSQTDNSRSSALFLPQTQSTIASATVVGNSAFGNATTSTYGGGMMGIVFPRISLDVKCSTDAPNLEQHIYDTKFINQSLKTKYKVSQ